jgi:large subunit ribosomal protein L25
MITLTITKRDPKGDLEALRSEGKIPAVFYGKKQPSTPITIAYSDFAKVWRKAGETTPITLSGDGLEVMTLVHDMDIHPVTGRVRHIDFYAFDKDKKIKLAVPVEFTGVSGAVKDLGGTLVKVLYELEIESDPTKIPHSIVVDISTLVDFESTIHAKNITLPAGVTLVTKDDEVVAAIARPREEKEEESAPIDLSTIEVAKKGKEAKEGEEGAAEADGDKK